MLFLGVLLFFAAEIIAFVVVAQHIGFLWALAVLALVSALGPFIVRHVGLGMLARTQERLLRGERPTRDLLDGLVILIGGAMICVPGFISDALGLLLMIGPVRHLVIRAAGHRLARRVQTVRTGRWRVVSVGSRPVRDEPPPAPGRPGLPLGPGDSERP
ncbi:MAG: FxsA family protein [Acidimicrobiales bacterium]